jgi:hypothetical protein
LTGCAERITNIARVAPPGKVGAVYVDAKQRAVTFVPVPTETVITTSTNGTVTETVVSKSTPVRVCAEPSPDALTALATSAQGNLNAQDKLALGLAINQSESAASIGLRTQSIQLMRDVLFRICEDYQSGSLTPAGVETLTRRYQSSMVAILAIEQLTGALRAPAVKLGGSASTGGAEAVATIFQAQQKAKADFNAADVKASVSKKAHDDAVAALKALNDAGEADADKIKKATTEVDTTKTALDKDNADKKAKAETLKEATAALAAVAPGDSSTSATADFDKPDTPDKPVITGTTADVVARAVKDIVSETLSLGFMREGCATMLVASAEGRSKVIPAPSSTPPKENFADACLAYFKATADSAAAANEIQRALVRFIDTAPKTEDGGKAVAAIIAAGYEPIKPAVVVPQAVSVASQRPSAPAIKKNVKKK